MTFGVRLVAAAAMAAGLFAGAAVAQQYPAKPVRVLIPWPPGGANDVVGRIVFQRMGDQLGQQFIIDNRGGASGTIGAEVVAKSPPDGYTIMVHSAAHVTNPHLYKKLGYDTLKDFIGVTALALQNGMLVVHPSVPAKNVKEYVALARARPGEIAYGSSGNGSFVHLAMALIGSMTNTKMTHIPFRGGGPSVIALLSGEIQSMTATVGSVMPHLNSGRLRVLGVTSGKRAPAFPDVPSIGETVKGYDFTAWIGAFVPANTPRPIVDRLNSEIRKAMAHPEVLKILTSQTLDPMPMTPEEFEKRLRVDYDRYEKLIKLTGATLD